MLLEYLLITKLKLNGFFQRNIYKKWYTGTKGDVLLIHGLHERYNFLGKIAKHLNTLGFRIHILKDIGTNTQTIKKSVVDLENYIRKTKLKKFNIICHSKGGLIAAYFLKTSKLANTANKVISIATPYKGSIFAKLFDSDSFVESEVIKEVNSNPYGNERIINLYPAFDNHVVPNKNLVLSGAHNYKIDIVGHTRILTSQKTLEVISEVI